LLTVRPRDPEDVREALLNVEQAVLRASWDVKVLRRRLAKLEKKETAELIEKWGIDVRDLCE
jgi:hypothetical protein